MSRAPAHRVRSTGDRAATARCGAPAAARRGGVALSRRRAPRRSGRGRTPRVEPQGAVTIGTPFRYTIEVTAASTTVEVLVRHSPERSAISRSPTSATCRAARRNGRAVVDALVHAGRLRDRRPRSCRRRGAVPRPDGEALSVAAPDTPCIVESLARAAGPTPPPTSATSRRRSPCRRLATVRRCWLASLAGIAAVAGVGAVSPAQPAGARAPDRAGARRTRCALDALDPLRARSLLEQGGFEEYYVRLSAIVRDYLEGPLPPARPGDDDRGVPAGRAARRRAAAGTAAAARPVPRRGRPGQVRPPPCRRCSDAERAYDGGARVRATSTRQRPRRSPVRLHDPVGAAAARRCCCWLARRARAARRRRRCAIPLLGGLRAVGPGAAHALALAAGRSARRRRWCCWSSALARPQLGKAATQVHSEGIDIMLAVDISGSMLAEDFTLGAQRANRLEAVKSVVHEFLDGAAGGSHRPRAVRRAAVHAVSADARPRLAAAEPRARRRSA